MELNSQAFLSAWETAITRLQREALIQDAWWGGITLSEIFATLEKAVASVKTVEALFERLYRAPAVGIIPYAAMHVLRPLVTPATQPETLLVGDIAVEDSQVVYGSATIAGTLQNDGALIVFGDLIIEGIYDDAAWGRSLLVVGGSVRARSIISSGDCLILGDVMVSEVVYGHANNHPLLVGGTLRSKVLLEESHYTRSSALEVQEVAHLSDIARLREIFVDALFLENGALSTGLLFNRLELGQQVYRS